jgi:anti-sigma regulatory factor (Ser/Thr protein kinase)
VRVEVRDEGEGTPDPRPADELSEHGRGLFLVTTFASAWGTEQTPGRGKIVWAELPRANVVA